jgi:hypothetical protein
MTAQESDNNTLPTAIVTALQRAPSKASSSNSTLVVRNEVAQDLYRLMLFLADTNPRTGKSTDVIYKAFPQMLTMCPTLRALGNASEGLATRSYIEIVGNNATTDRLVDTVSSRINTALRGLGND